MVGDCVRARTHTGQMHRTARAPERSMCIVRTVGRPLFLEHSKNQGHSDPRSKISLKFNP